MITAWRIVKSGRQHHAFSGEGSRRYGGRWNSKGTPIVYTAGSVSLASMEMLVNLPAAALLQKFIRIPVRFSSELVFSVGIEDLPQDWNSRPASPSTKDIGDQWVNSRRSVVLKVPSIVVPEEYNYLVNPRHPDFNKVEIGEPILYFF